MGTLPLHHLPRLSEDDCLSLFMQRAFGHGRQEPPNLVMHAKEIVKKCGGIPLAAKALGGLMRFKTDERERLFVKESEIWNLPEEESDILPALKLSYYQLPSHLKQCFAYCSIFPKDHRIVKKKLILLWMAEGFIQPSDGSKQMEDIGGEYFNNLLWRSFFQDVDKDEDGNILWCKMHDLVHDLACSVAGIECSIVWVKNAVSIPNISRCLFLECECSEWVLTDQKPSRRSNHLRTLLVLLLRTLTIFIVGKDSGCGIRELQGLNLGEELTIQNLENVMCAADAQEANLKDKPNLHELHFSWGPDIDLQLEGNVKQTLEGLRPHPNLKRLTVEEYMGVGFPHWMSSSLLPNLIKVSLINCRRCEQLPPLSHLPFPNVLVISGMDAFKSIGKHFYGDDVTELTTLPCLPSMKGLELGDGNEMLLGSVANLSSFSSLKVEGFKELRSLPDGLFENHTHLLRLDIKECPKLESVSRELGNLAALESLSIYWCDKQWSNVLQPTSLELSSKSINPGVSKLNEFDRGAATCHNTGRSINRWNDSAGVDRKPVLASRFEYYAL
ncbi:putative disease resistance protein RGA1 [Magnolia sinica]|uniref:putative disease resistance protein RGA1 n=1 Tax=Magnolia sinica TaxID=86752 RepID=UPI00265B6AB6|nr:putative disease resistance protein RGA1 [Magnolia sinica]